MRISAGLKVRFDNILNADMIECWWYPLKVCKIETVLGFRLREGNVSGGEGWCWWGRLPVW